MRLALALLLVVGAACDAAAPLVDQDDAIPAARDSSAGDEEGPRPPALVALHVVATQNAGTTELMDLLVFSELRPVCSESYGNNLCTVDSERLLADALLGAAPQVLFLEEVWEQARCAEPGRPPEANLPPFACSAGDTSQLARILPPGLRWACAAGYPDNCVAFHPDAFEPTLGEACRDRDCSPAMMDIDAGCGPPGRIAALAGRTASGDATLVVVHTSAGIESDDRACRATQLGALREFLGALPNDRVLLVGGDFNFDPQQDSGPDVDAYDRLLSDLSLVRLPDDGETHRLLLRDYDLVLARGWSAPGCRVSFVDPLEAGPEIVPMLDHGLVVCAGVEGG